MMLEMRTMIGKKCPDAVLADVMTKANWDINTAAENYFMQGMAEKYAEV